MASSDAETDFKPIITFFFFIINYILSRINVFNDYY